MTPQHHNTDAVNDLQCITDLQEEFDCVFLNDSDAIIFDN